MNERAETANSEAWPGTGGTPLIASRSLGRLLRLESLAFKVECWQPTGSWLDRSAAVLVAGAIVERRTGLCIVGVDAWTLPLAVRCAQAGLRLVVLAPTFPGDDPSAPNSDCPADAYERGWLPALGVRRIAVKADEQAVRRAAPGFAERAGLRLVSPDDRQLPSGLSIVVQEIELAGLGERLLAVPGLVGREARWLAETARQRAPAVPLPLDSLLDGPSSRPCAVVGMLEPPDKVADDPLVLSIPVSTREADAARRLLAREEGLIVSRRGGVGLAGLVRAVREDRARRPRERRLRDVTSAVVVLTGDPLRAGADPPPQPDAVPTRPVSLEALTAEPGRLLVEPPGR